MKVKVAFTVDIDVEAWCGEYGTSGRVEVSKDVVLHATNSVIEHFESVGVLTEAQR